jgi:2-dehydropantoate 2-reductase
MTTILPVQNGIPWWYFQGYDGEFEGYQITALDPNGTVAEYIETRQIVGCVPFMAGTIVEPGVVRHDEGEWFPVGELDGARTDRVRGVVNLFEHAGLRSRVLEDIRSELWLKELGNLALNPISALTGATLEEICRDSETRTLARRMMEEAKPVAEMLGVEFRRSIEDRIDGAEAVGDHKTSMLQDIEQGNPLETEALLGSVVELAELTDQSIPTIKNIYALVSLLESTRTNQ